MFKFQKNAETPVPTGGITGDYIRRLRLKNYLTQTAFAHRIGVHRSTIQRWETGKFTPWLSHAKIISEMIKNGDLEDV